MDIAVILSGYHLNLQRLPKGVCISTFNIELTFLIYLPNYYIYCRYFQQLGKVPKYCLGETLAQKSKPIWKVIFLRRANAASLKTVGSVCTQA